MTLSYPLSLILKATMTVDLDDLERLQLLGNSGGDVPCLELSDLPCRSLTKRRNDGNDLSNHAPLDQLWIALLHYKTDSAETLALQ